MRPCANGSPLPRDELSLRPLVTKSLTPWRVSEREEYTSLPKNNKPGKEINYTSQKKEL